MAETVTLDLARADDLVRAALQASRVSPENAACVAAALVAAERDGQKGHGLSRVPSYAAQTRSGKVDGFAVAAAERVAPALVRVDARDGFAFPALALAVEEVAALAEELGIAAAAVHRSHHLGQATYHVERLAARGLLGLMFGNSPKAIAPWGGRDGVFGTNPIAMAAPRGEGPPIVVDTSLARVARGKIMAAAQAGETIPDDWALDAEGRPTTDPEAALLGTVIPIGDAKGVALALLVEVLSASLTGANHGFEASSFFTAEGDPPGVGHLVIALKPGPLSGGAFAERLDALAAAVEGQESARLPGSRRHALRAKADAEGLTVPAKLVAEIEALSRK
ncbi:MAG: Ldh family oxidoreductase [Pseudomonadota bacterium]